MVGSGDRARGPNRPVPPSRGPSSRRLRDDSGIPEVNSARAGRDAPTSGPIAPRALRSTSQERVTHEKTSAIASQELPPPGRSPRAADRPERRGRRQSQLQRADRQRPDLDRPAQPRLPVGGAEQDLRVVVSRHGDPPDRRRLSARRCLGSFQSDGLPPTATTSSAIPAPPPSPSAISARSPVRSPSRRG